MKKLLKNASLISIAIFACYASTSANATDPVSKLTCALNPSSCSSTLGAGVQAMVVPAVVMAVTLVRKRKSQTV